MKIKHRHFIQKSQIKELRDDILSQYDENFVAQIFPIKARIELIQTDDGDTLYAINNVLKLWKSKEGYILSELFWEKFESRNFHRIALKDHPVIP